MSEPETTPDAHQREMPERTPSGRFVRTEESLRRDAEALRLRSRGQTFRAISDALGYGGESNAKKAVDRATKDILAGPAEDYVRQQLERIALMRRKAMEVLERDHVVVSHGHVIRIGPPPREGEEDTRTPLLDDGPVLQAIATLRQLDEREAKLLGLDAPQKLDATVHQVDPQDVELMQMVSEQKARNAAERARIQEPG